MSKNKKDTVVNPGIEGNGVTEEQLFSTENTENIEGEKEMEMELEMENPIVEDEVENKEPIQELSNEGESNDMELTLDDDDMENMEKLANEKVIEEAKQHKEDKSKRGPKGPRTPKEGEEKTENKKEKIDLSQTRILEREIKKGRVVSPQARVEKNEETGKYDMLLSEGIIYKEDAKKFEKIGEADRLVEAKWMVTLAAAEKFGEKYEHTDDEGKSYKHDYVRVELHKPGRDKDVTEIYTVGWAKGEASKLEGKAIKKKADEDKKVEKESEQPSEENKESQPA